MLNRHTHAAGLYPTDLDLLKRVFDTLCTESRCQPNSPDSEATAIRLVNLFESGQTTEDELLEGARPCMRQRTG